LDHVYFGGLCGDPEVRRMAKEFDACRSAHKPRVGSFRITPYRNKRGEYYPEHDQPESPAWHRNRPKRLLLDYGIYNVNGTVKK